ncbi:MAG TPA: glycosyltransferase 87 family protein [Solirubrobacterales bacterium]
MSAGLAYALMWVGFAAYLGAVWLAPRLERPAVLGAVGIAVLGFALAPVLLSHDVYSYVNYARLGVLHGLDPYLHPPSAEPADPAFAEVEWTETTSAYGPLFTLATYPLAWLTVAGAVATLKAAAAASVVAMAALLARLAAWRGEDPRRAAVFLALNPLVLVHVVGGAHNDGPAMLLGMLGVAAVLAARGVAGGIALVAAAAVKLPAALIAPFALLGARGNAPRLLLGAGLALLAVGAPAFAAFEWNWLDTLGLAGENQGRTSYMSVPVTAARLSGLDPEVARIGALVLFAGLIAHLLAWTWRGGDWVRAAAWASLGLLLATSWLLPWFLIWALPLAAISRDRTLQGLVLALTAFQLTTRIPI